MVTSVTNAGISSTAALHRKDFFPRSVHDWALCLDGDIKAAMKYMYQGIAMAAIASAIAAISPCVAADGESGSVFDKVWSYATLYDNEDNRYIQKFALSGRLQADSAWLDSDQGRFSDAFLWRRFRFGFKADLFRN